MSGIAIALGLAAAAPPPPPPIWWSMINRGVYRYEYTVTVHPNDCWTDTCVEARDPCNRDGCGDA